MIKSKKIPNEVNAITGGINIGKLLLKCAHFYNASSYKEFSYIEFQFVFRILVALQGAQKLYYLANRPGLGLSPLVNLEHGRHGLQGQIELDLRGRVLTVCGMSISFEDMGWCC
jgi:hypothetical protein